MVAPKDLIRRGQSFSSLSIQITISSSALLVSSRQQSDLDPATLIYSGFSLRFVNLTEQTSPL
jgi:hypothetical protein